MELYLEMERFHTENVENVRGESFTGSDLFVPNKMRDRSAVKPIILFKKMYTYGVFIAFNDRPASTENPPQKSAVKRTENKK